MMIWLTLIVFLSSPSLAMAYDRGEELLWACKADESKNPEVALQKMHCIGYITGVLDGIQLVFAVRPESKFFCPPASGMSADQQVRIVTKWLEDNPKELHEGARMSILIAFSKAFPCK